MELHKPQVGKSQKPLGHKMFLGTSRGNVGDCAKEPGYPLRVFPGQRWEVMVSESNIDNRAVNTHFIESVPKKCQDNSFYRGVPVGGLTRSVL